MSAKRQPTFDVQKEVATEPLRRLSQAAQRWGFECISKTWRGWQTSYSFRCAQGHECTRTATCVVFNSIVCKDCLDQHRFERLQQAAEAKGGKCLERRYLGDGIPHRFVCAYGHKWKVRAAHIVGRGSWCRRCAQIAHGEHLKLIDGLERLQQAAAQRGGRCLSDSYSATYSYYRFQCAHGHQWETEGAEVIRGSWCRQCDSEKKRINYRLADGIERLRKAAQDKGGECLSQEYTGAAKRYLLRCQHGHEWESTGQRIMNGAWCGICANNNKKLSIEEMRKMAHERGGVCLSYDYVNSMTKLHWECHLGHRWYALQGNVRKGHWCPDCGHMNQIRNPKSKERWKYLASSQSVVCKS